MILHRHISMLVALAVGWSVMNSWAAAPDSPPVQARSLPPGGELRVAVTPMAFKAPAQPWRIPPQPVYLTGKGVCLYYLVPFQRVKTLLPPGAEPYPGPQTIYFRVDCLQWTDVNTGTVKGKRARAFNELAYRFEIIQHGRRGTFPLRVYFDQEWPVLWTRAKGNYPAFQLTPAAVNFSPFMHFFQFRRDTDALAVLDIKPKQGLESGANLFTRRTDAHLWQGEGLELTQGDKAPLLRQLTVRPQAAVPITLVLQEPQDWRILSEDEALQPDKIFILDDIQGTWSGAKGKK